MGARAHQRALATTPNAPDPTARALLEFASSLPIVNGQAADISTLDEERLRAHGIQGVRPGEAAEGARQAQAQLDLAREQLGTWVSAVWGPWSALWHQVDKGRSFYKRLFDLRSRLEREREMTECLWGFGRLGWAPGQEDEGATEVDHPLLTVPIEVSLDQRTGKITLGPAGATQVENGWSIGLELADRAGFNEQRLSAEQLEVDPWGPSATEVMVSLLRQVDIDGTNTLDDKSGHDLSHAHLATGRWVVFVRRCQPNLIGFIEDQRQLYKDTKAIVPPAFAALVIDEPSKLGSSAVAALGTDDLGMPPPPTPERTQRILLPLPTNDEQMRIVELARCFLSFTAPAQQAAAEAAWPPFAHGAICSVKAMSKLLPIEEAAGYLGVPVAVLRHLRAHRLVPVVRFGKRIYFQPEDLDRLVEARLEPAMRGPLATLKPLRRLAP